MSDRERDQSNIPKRTQNRNQRFFIFLGCVSGVLVILGLALFGYFSGVWQDPETESQSNIASFNSDERVSAALYELAQNPKKASVVESQPVAGQKINLTFNGLTDTDVIEEILDILDENDLTATFYVTGAQAREFPEAVQTIVDRGHSLGNYTLRGEAEMDQKSPEEVVADICRAEEILLDVGSVLPDKVRFYETELTAEVLQAVYASGFPVIEEPSVTLSYQSFSNPDQVQPFVDNLPYASVVAIKTEGALTENEYAGEPEGNSVSSSLPAETGSAATVSSVPYELPEEPSERLVLMVEWVAQALNNTNFDADYEKIRWRNDGALAQPVSAIKTTEKAVSYLFYGLGNETQLRHTLASLQEMGARGTFYLSAADVEQYPAQVEMIYEAGQAFGVAVVPGTAEDYFSAVHEISEVTNHLLEYYQYSDVQTVIQPWGEASDDVLEAVSSLHMDMIQWDTSIMKEEVLTAEDAQVVIDTIFGEREYELMRGQTVYFRMDLEEIGDELIGDIVREMEGTRNIYVIKPVHEVYHNDQYRYEYPLPEEEILPEILNVIHPGQLDEDVMAVAPQHYIGNPDISTSRRLPGFSSEEIAQLDKTGLIVNDNNAAFLTFDDWGTDASITKLLDVLDEYHVKATFFIVTRNVQDNPNLLRAVAEAGHDIGCHTNSHYVLSNPPENATGNYTELTQEQIPQLQEDVQEAYQILQSIVGDIENEQGRPVLTNAFRPPTMEVSRNGMQAVFDSGFSYVVNGAYTSHDYEASSANALYRDIANNMNSGTVAIFHMSVDAQYTAEALGMYFEQNEARAEEQQLTFARLSEYLDEAWIGTPVATSSSVPQEGVSNA